MAHTETVTVLIRKVWDTSVGQYSGHNGSEHFLSITSCIFFQYFWILNPKPYVWGPWIKWSFHFRRWWKMVKMHLAVKVVSPLSCSPKCQMVKYCLLIFVHSGSANLKMFPGSYFHAPCTLQLEYFRNKSCYLERRLRILFYWCGVKAMKPVLNVR